MALRDTRVCRPCRVTARVPCLACLPGSNAARNRDGSKAASNRDFRNPGCQCTHPGSEGTCARGPGTCTSARGGRALPRRRLDSTTWLRICPGRPHCCGRPAPGRAAWATARPSSTSTLRERWRPRMGPQQPWASRHVALPRPVGAPWAGNPPLRQRGSSSGRLGPATALPPIAELPWASSPTLGRLMTHTEAREPWAGNSHSLPRIGGSPWASDPTPTRVCAHDRRLGQATHRGAWVSSLRLHGGPGLCTHAEAR